jgi:predicted Zn-dependent peptidase
MCAHLNLRPSRSKVSRLLGRLRSGCQIFVTALLGLSLISPVINAQSAIRSPKLDYTVFTLDNGLKVVLSEDHSTPVAHVELWYQVGSKDERPGRTGFAHLFEHLMFKGSKNVQTDQHLSFISQVGGDGNAYTNEDSTVFLQTVPSQYLPLVLWLEADRMATLRFDQKTLDAEREVVKEERRLRYDNEPFGLLAEIVYDHAYTTHPYKHQAIGSMEDLSAASIDEVRDFYNTYYVPSNATLVVVGDINSANTLQMIKHYFGRVPKSRIEVPREIPREPPQTAERRVTVEAANWPLPAVVVAYHIVYDGHPDAYPLHIASKVLSDGQSARIHRRLVYDEQLAVAAFGQGNIIEDPNLFFAVAIVAPGQTPEMAETALIEELEKLKQEPISDLELQRTKNQFARDYIIGRMTNAQKAAHLGHASVIHDDITTADGEFDIFMNVTKEEVQRVARTYFTDANRLVIRILPRGSLVQDVGRVSR